MGEIYLARLEGAQGFEKLCVIKKILPQLAEDAEFVERFVGEARTLVKLSHGSIAQVLDMGLHEGEAYMALEYVDGKDLRKVAARVRDRQMPLPLTFALFVTSRVLDALAYAHRKRDDEDKELNLVHRDISPQNILISYEGEVKVIDFGLAKSRLSAAKTNPSIILGKFLYMSPEQARHQPLDRRSDLYAVGLCLYELISGQNPFDALPPGELMSAVVNPRIPPLNEVVPLVPASVAQAVMKSLAVDPAQRFQTAEEFRGRLLACLVELDANSGPEDVSRFMRDVFTSEYQQERKLLGALKDVPRGAPAASAEPARAPAQTSTEIPEVAFKPQGALLPPKTIRLDGPVEAQPLSFHPTPRSREGGPVRDDGETRPGVSLNEPTRPGVSLDEPTRPSVPIEAVDSGMRPRLRPGRPEALPGPSPTVEVRTEAPAPPSPSARSSFPTVEMPATAAAALAQSPESTGKGPALPWEPEPSPPDAAPAEPPLAATPEPELFTEQPPLPPAPPHAPEPVAAVPEAPPARPPRAPEPVAAVPEAPPARPPRTPEPVAALPEVPPARPPEPTRPAAPVPAAPVPPMPRPPEAPAAPAMPARAVEPKRPSAPSVPTVGPRPPEATGAAPGSVPPAVVPEPRRHSVPPMPNVGLKPQEAAPPPRPAAPPPLAPPAAPWPASAAGPPVRPVEPPRPVAPAVPVPAPVPPARAPEPPRASMPGLAAAPVPPRPAASAEPPRLTPSPRAAEPAADARAYAATIQVPTVSPGASASPDFSVPWQEEAAPESPPEVEATPASASALHVKTQNDMSALEPQAVEDVSAPQGFDATRPRYARSRGNPRHDDTQPRAMRDPATDAHEPAVESSIVLGDGLEEMTPPPARVKVTARRSRPPTAGGAPSRGQVSPGAGTSPSLRAMAARAAPKPAEPEEEEAQDEAPDEEPVARAKAAPEPARATRRERVMTVAVIGLLAVLIGVAVTMVVFPAFSEGRSKDTPAPGPENVAPQGPPPAQPIVPRPLPSAPAAPGTPASEKAPGAGTEPSAVAVAEAKAAEQPKSPAHQTEQPRAAQPEEDLPAAPPPAAPTESEGDEENALVPPPTRKAPSHAESPRGKKGRKEKEQAQVARPLSPLDQDWSETTRVYGALKSRCEDQRLTILCDRYDDLLYKVERASAESETELLDQSKRLRTDMSRTLRRLKDLP
jgi:serine/threonine protein kinase